MGDPSPRAPQEVWQRRAYGCRGVRVRVLRCPSFKSADCEGPLPGCKLPWLAVPRGMTYTGTLLPAVGSSPTPSALSTFRLESG